MRAAVRFLTSLARSFSVLGLYREGHPARERAVDEVLTAVQRLQEIDPEPEFTFLKGDVLYHRQPLGEFREWEWAERLGAVGVQRLRFTGPVTRPDLALFLEEIGAKVSGHPLPTAEARPTRPTVIRYDQLRLRGEEEEGPRGGEGEDEDEPPTVTLGFTLKEETDTVRWLHEELKAHDQLHLLEAEATVRSLAVAMHGDHEFLIPLLQLKEFDQYTTTHALNVSILSMALAEHLGFSSKDVRAFGVSGLLHDLGKTRVPEEILNKPGKLTDAEREVMNQHPVEGARIIMEADQHLDLAAVVAYEHHIRIDGGGYPSLAYPRACHQCSNLVHVCDVYDALRTDRPYRDAWEHQRVLDYIEEGRGSEFDPRIARGFIRMMEKWEGRLAVVDSEEEALFGEPDLEERPADSPGEPDESA